MKIRNARSHITTSKRKITALAQKSEVMFDKIADMATEINMRVNKAKTQLLWIHANKNSEIRSYIRTNEGEIMSGDQLKILGFLFNKDPSAVYHVEQLVEKLYKKFWSLRYLKKSGMAEEKLLGVYKSIIRPTAGFITCSPFHSP